MECSRVHALCIQYRTKTKKLHMKSPLKAYDFDAFNGTFWSTFSVEFPIFSVENNELVCNKRIRTTFSLIKAFLHRRWKGAGIENPINIKFALITKFPQDISDPPHFAIWTTCTSTNCWLLNHCWIICTSTTYWTNSTKGKSMFSNTSVIGHLKNEVDWLYHHLLSKSFLASNFL